MSVLYNGTNQSVQLDNLQRNTKDRNAEAPSTESLTQPLVTDKSKVKTYRSTDSESDAGSTSKRRLGKRLNLRRKLMIRRRWLVNVEFVMAMTGILLMMVENELYYADHTEKDTAGSFVIKLAITVSTGVLLLAISLYYQAGIELRMFDGRVDDPFAVTPISTWLLLILELCVCAVHPFPGNIQAEFLVVNGGTSYASIDGILSVLMMLRLYLVGKFIVVHSQLLTDTSTQCVTAVSHVKVNINFVMKAALHKHPAEVLTAMILAMYAVSVWSMRTCELYYTDMPENASFSEAMWLSAVTFLTVGYGDLTPNTHCGRFIAVATALMGLCSTALLVAVIARKLEQTHRERYVHNFLMRLHLRNKFKGAASDVVKYVVKLCWLKKKGGIPVSALDRTVMQWRLSSAIRTMRSSRAAQAEVEEASVGLSEVCQLISTLDKRQQEGRRLQHEVLARLDALQGQVATLLERDVASAAVDSRDGGS